MTFLSLKLTFSSAIWGVIKKSIWKTYERSTPVAYFSSWSLSCPSLSPLFSFIIVLFPLPFLSLFHPLISLSVCICSLPSLWLFLRGRVTLLSDLQGITPRFVPRASPCADEPWTTYTANKPSKMPGWHLTWWVDVPVLLLLLGVLVFWRRRGAKAERRFGSFMGLILLLCGGEGSVRYSLSCCHALLLFLAVSLLLLPSVFSFFCYIAVPLFPRFECMMKAGKSEFKRFFFLFFFNKLILLHIHPWAMWTCWQNITCTIKYENCNIWRCLYTRHLNYLSLSLLFWMRSKTELLNPRDVSLFRENTDSLRVIDPGLRFRDLPVKFPFIFRDQSSNPSLFFF